MLRTRIRASRTTGVVISLLFAVVVTGLQTGDLFLPAPEIGQASPVTLRLPTAAWLLRSPAALGTAFPARTVYEHVRVVIAPRVILQGDNENHRAAIAFERGRRAQRTYQLASFAILNVLLALMLTSFLRRFGQGRTQLLRTQLGLLTLLFFVTALAKAVLAFTILPEFWMPVAVVPLWAVASFDRRTALVTSLVLAFLASSLLQFDIVLLTVVLSRGLAASILFFRTKRPRQMLTAGFLSGLCAVVVFLALTVTLGGSLAPLDDLRLGAASLLLACVGGGFLAGLFAHLLKEPAARLLGHVSRDRLFTLADLEQPLLRKMSTEAPGSWEHSRAMANLAEAAASAIGADALLTRVGAYYHDLGKTVQPTYFVENLPAGDESPHQRLAPHVSADAIMAHVVMGTKILRDGGIPEPVVEFAYTHHGTQVVEFFWHKCQEQGNPQGLSEQHFRYPGMKPQTKETAILMIIDSVEAASRTIDPPARSAFEEMIQRVLFTKLKSGQLDESGLSLEECRILVTRLPDTLVNMYHARIKYPWQKKP